MSQLPDYINDEVDDSSIKEYIIGIDIAEESLVASELGRISL